MLAILTVCLVGMVNLVFGQSQYYYVAPNGTMYPKDEEANKTQRQATEKQRQLELDKYRKMIEEDIKKGGTGEINESQIQQSMIEKQNLKTVLEFIVNNCYAHSDRPNPVQDLIDKGFLSEFSWKNETCKSVNEAHNELVKKGY